MGTIRQGTGIGAAGDGVGPGEGAWGPGSRRGLRPNVVQDGHARAARVTSPTGQALAPQAGWPVDTTAGTPYGLFALAGAGQGPELPMNQLSPSGVALCQFLHAIGLKRHVDSVGRIQPGDGPGGQRQRARGGGADPPEQRPLRDPRAHRLHRPAHIRILARGERPRGPVAHPTPPPLRHSRGHRHPAFPHGLSRQNGHPQW